MQMFNAISQLNSVNIKSCIILIYLTLVQCLTQLPVEDKNITVNDSVILSTLNKLFSILQLNKQDHILRFARNAALHGYLNLLSIENENYFTVVSNLKGIWDKIKNNKSDLMVTVNNVFDENYDFEDKNPLDADDEYIVKYIDNYLNNIPDFNRDNSQKGNLEGNWKISELINNIEEFSNYSVEKELNFNNSDDNYTSDENEFWQQSGRRIFKGERSKIKKFPFMATIQIFNNFHCAGSIIKSDLIITASSCLQLAWNNRFFRENPSFLSARVGSSFYNGGGEVIPVLEIYFHPSYDPKSLKNNICILRLIRHLKFKLKNKRIKRIDFDRNAHTLPVNTHGITVVGWGAKAHSPIIENPMKSIISYAELDIYPLEDCQDIYLKQYVTNKNFCAGFISRGGGACNRDVGGPGIVGGILVGVISFGSPVCGMPDAPTVFTKIGYYADWIEQVMELDVPVSKKRTTERPYKNPFDFPQSTLRAEPSTFKLAPITGKIRTPMSVTDTDNLLRIDDTITKDFLNNIGSSKEMEEYKEILQMNIAKSEEQKDEFKIEGVTVHEYINQIDDAQETQTKLGDFSFEVTTEKYSEDGVSPDADAAGDEIAKLMTNVNLKKIVEEEIAKTKIEAPSKLITKNDSVVTLFHISDDETNNRSDKESSEETVNSEVSEGMSISIDNFEDLTRAQAVDTILPENELYNLLSELITEEVQNINVDTA